MEYDPANAAPEASDRKRTLLLKMARALFEVMATPPVTGDESFAGSDTLMAGSSNELAGAEVLP